MSKTKIKLETKQLAGTLQDRNEKQVRFPVEPGSFILTKDGLFEPNLDDEAVKIRNEKLKKLKKDKKQ